jgi:4'-phosphopantetheinyl transferase
VIEWLIETSLGQPPEAWLSLPETAVFTRLATSKRRDDWLLGRWTTKCLLQGLADKSGAERQHYSQMSILAAADGAPEAWIGTNGVLHRADSTISISHVRGVSFCAAMTPAHFALGADIEAIEARCARFVSDYFTAGEIEAVEQAAPEERDRLVTAVWSGKEAALKAVRTGLRVDTRAVSCDFSVPLGPQPDWQSFAINWRGDAAQTYPKLVGWWRIWHDFVLTLAVSAAPGHTLAH